MAEALLNPYCTLRELRDEIRNEDTDATVVDQLTRAINDASRYIEIRVGRDFSSHDHTVTPLRLTRFSHAIFDDVIYFPYRAISITEVKADNVVLTEGVDYELLTNSLGETYGLQCLTGDWRTILKSGIRWTVAEFLIKGQFGYTQTASTDVPAGIPAEIRRACILIAAAWSGKATYEVIDLEGNKQDVASKQIPKAAFELLGLRTPILV